MRLVREVPSRDRRLSLGGLLGLFGITAVTLAVLVGPTIASSFATSKVQIARERARSYAHEGYAIWLWQNPTIKCPPDVAALSNLISDGSDRDPYGRAYQLYCNNNGIYIQSRGEDAMSGTADDIWSHSK